MSTTLQHTPTKPSNLFGIDSLSAPMFAIQIAQAVQYESLRDTVITLPVFFLKKLGEDYVLRVLSRYSNRALSTLSRLLDSACSDYREVIESLEKNCPVEINFLDQGRTEYFPRVDLSTQEEIDTLTARIRDYEYIINLIDSIIL